MFLASGLLIVETFSGADGSRSIKEVQVDASGTGKNFVPAKMIVNGNAVRAVHCIPCHRTNVPLRIPRLLARTRSLPSFLLVPNAVVVLAKTFVLRPLLQPLVSEIVS